MDVAERVAAWTGAFVSLATLTWTIVSWRMSRHKIKVFVTNILDARPGLEPLHLIQIKAVNVGLDKVAITNWGVLARGLGEIAIFNRHPSSNVVPATLNQNEYVEFYFYADALRDLNSDSGVSFKKMFPWVELSNNKRVFSKTSIPLTKLEG